MTLRVGFIGLGAIGRPMAERLVAVGLDPLVYDVAADAVGVLERAGARVAGSPRELAERCDVVGICVPADAHVRTVCDGSDGVFAGARPGGVVAVHSTVRPATILALGESAARRGIGVVDACISGGEAGAADGTLVCMVGGASDDVERCRPMIAAWARSIVHTGPLGSGTRMKLCNNVMTYVTLQALYEGWRLAHEAGLSDAVLEEITRASGVLSDRMERYFPRLTLAPDEVGAAGVQVILAHYLAIAEKDLAIALELARDLAVDLPATRLCAERMAEVYRVARRS